MQVRLTLKMLDETKAQGLRQVYGDESESGWPLVLVHRK